jgi:coatomer subunit delta
MFDHIVNCWPTPSNDGTCEVNIEYELENEDLTLHDIVISIPLPYVTPAQSNALFLIIHFTRTGSYPTVSSHAGEWSLNPSSHSIDWSIPLVSADQRSGSLEFTIGGDDVGVFFPVKVSFVGQGSMAGISIAAVNRIDNTEVIYSSESFVTAEDYQVV